MIYSIVPMEEIFPPEDLPDQDQRQIIDLEGIKAEVRLVGSDTFEIQRIFTSDLKNYLKPSLQPGTRLKRGFLP